MKTKERNGQSTEGCCGGPAPDGVAACCVKDAEAKAEGKSGCGCGGATAQASDRETACYGSDRAMLTKKQGGTDYVTSATIEAFKPAS